MDYIAESKNVKMSPRKVRLVIDSVKKMQPEVALLQLSVVHKRAAQPVLKTIQSAMANAVNTFKAQKGDLVIKEILVNEGEAYKRFHFAGRGRSRPYKKRTSHIRVILSDKKAKTMSVAKVVEQPKVEVKKEMKAEVKVKRERKTKMQPKAEHSMNEKEAKKS